MEPFASLYVMRGDPDQAGVRLDLASEETVVGRPSNDYIPDIPIANAFISRRHFMVRQEEGTAVLYDLGSKHGTEIAGKPLEPYKPYRLQESDLISLAKGTVVMHFAYAFTDYTLELETRSLLTRLQLAQTPVMLEKEKRECYMSGKRIAMSEKEWLLFELLYEHAGELVPIPALKKNVWPERVSPDDDVPDVGIEELNALVYRVRKKIDSPYCAIKTVRGVGYIYEENGEASEESV
ncbi:FHA domain-containing protein [Paenibacillus contaminans]|uniref:Transcriptional regulator n=1 Tax=Paenibacillus contaminans TaxID=450362 RepID=A0A329MTX4_9BACL|nr:FHA domain-containing protein [Paenibacillus contaminans]RAV23425.1 transcriptional regulator [Paenibacillus contaminans]